MDTETTTTLAVKEASSLRYDAGGAAHGRVVTLAQSRQRRAPTAGLSGGVAGKPPLAGAGGGGIRGGGYRQQAAALGGSSRGGAARSTTAVHAQHWPGGPQTAFLSEDEVMMEGESERLSRLSLAPVRAGLLPPAGYPGSTGAESDGGGGGSLLETARESSQTRASMLEAAVRRAEKAAAEQHETQPAGVAAGSGGTIVAVAVAPVNGRTAAGAEAAVEVSQRAMAPPPIVTPPNAPPSLRPLLPATPCCSPVEASYR